MERSNSTSMKVVAWFMLPWTFKRFWSFHVMNVYLVHYMKINVLHFLL